MIYDHFCYHSLNLQYANATDQWSLDLNHDCSSIGRFVFRIDSVDILVHLILRVKCSINLDPSALTLPVALHASIMLNDIILNFICRNIFCNFRLPSPTTPIIWNTSSFTNIVTAKIHSIFFPYSMFKTSSFAIFSVPKSSCCNARDYRGVIHTHTHSRNFKSAYFFLSKYGIKWCSLLISLVSKSSNQIYVIIDWKRPKLVVLIWDKVIGRPNDHRYQEVIKFLGMQNNIVFSLSRLFFCWKRNCHKQYLCFAIVIIAW